MGRRCKSTKVSIDISRFEYVHHKQQQVADVLNQATRRAQAERSVVDSFSADGVGVFSDASPAALAKFLALHVPRWIRAVEEAGVLKQ